MRTGARVRLFRVALVPSEDYGDTVTVLAHNADLFLVDGGWVVLAIKAQSIDVTRKPSEVYQREIETMKARGSPRSV